MRQQAPATTRRVTAPPLRDQPVAPPVVDEGAAKKIVEHGAHKSAAFQQQSESSLVAVRLLHGALERARADAGVAVLSVELRDPPAGIECLEAYGSKERQETFFHKRHGARERT